MTVEDEVAPQERAREALLMGLRLSEGIDLAHFTARTGRTLSQSVDRGVLEQALSEGYLTLTPARLTATREGRIRLDALLCALLA
jgi:oxygen-independent coproporphyrinogen-3 oxidase